MTEDDDEDDKVIGRIHTPPAYGLAYVEMMKTNYRRWAAEGDPICIEVVKQMDGDDTEDQDDPSAHLGPARRRTSTCADTGYSVCLTTSRPLRAQ